MIEYYLTDWEYARHRLSHTIVRHKDVPIFVMNIGPEVLEERKADPLEVLDEEDLQALHEPRGPAPGIRIGDIRLGDRGARWEPFVEGGIIPPLQKKRGKLKIVAQYFRLNDPSQKVVSCPFEELDITPVPLGYINLENFAVFSSRKPIRGYWRQGLGEGNFLTKGPHQLRKIPFVPLYDTIINNYPSLENVIKDVESKVVQSRAFHRHWALSNNKGKITIDYRSTEVGVFDGRFTLHPRFHYLNEYLGEVRDAEHQKFARS